jgi:hypothetical protein
VRLGRDRHRGRDAVDQQLGERVAAPERLVLAGEDVVAAVPEVLLRPLEAAGELGRLEGVDDGVVDVGQRVEVDEAGRDDRVAEVERPIDRPREAVADLEDPVVLLDDLAVPADDVVAVGVADHEAGGEPGAHG